MCMGRNLILQLRSPMCRLWPQITSTVQDDVHKCINPHVPCVWLQAVRLLKKGGVLVYSTCTVTLAENEEQVAWALDTFPCLTLQPQVKALQIHSDACGVMSAKHHQITVQRFVFSSGASHRCRRHARSWPVTWAAAPPPEVQPWAELGRDRNGSSPPLQSRQGHYWLFYCQVPEKLNGGHVFSSRSHTGVQTGTAVFILWNCVHWRGGVDRGTLAAPEQLLSETAGHIGISFINTESKEKRGRVWRARGDGDWMTVGECSSAGVAMTTVTTQLPWWQRIGWIRELRSGSSVQKEVTGGINNLVCFSGAGDNWDL